MNLNGKKFSLLVAATLALLSTSVFAQGPADSTVGGSATVSTSSPAIPDAPLPPPAQGPGPVSTYPSGSTRGNWRVGISIYGWFPGMHGTVGALGHNASIHVPFTDVFHTLKGVIPIAVEADKGRFVMPIDFLWMKLGVDNGIPINDFTQTSIRTDLTQSIFTPKVGLRLLDADHLKFDALGGIRYWHLGLSNTLQPSGLGSSRSVNWVDGLGGGRFILPFGEKASVTLAGDAGAGQANLDYQAVGLLNFNVTPKFGMAVGWRYLDVDYTPTTNDFVYDTATTGAVAGFTFNFGGKPPVPPTVSCSASPSQVYPGEPVTVTANAVGLNPKLNTVYTWSGDGVTGNGSTATVNTSALNPGSYTAMANLKEGKPGKEGEKPWQVAGCSAAYTIREYQAPTLSCSASQTDLAPGGSSTITAQGASPQNRPLTYGYQASGGAISGNGTTATYSSSGASPGPVQITCSVSDGRITLTGHADPRGTPEFNQKLSERRVARAKAFLIEQGVPDANIDTQAMGAEHQLSKAEVRELIETNPQITDEQKKNSLRQLNVIVLAQNRRVDVTLSGSEQKGARHYPFNAEDSSTLLNLKKAAHKAAPKQ